MTTFFLSGRAEHLMSLRDFMYNDSNRSFKVHFNFFVSSFKSLISKSFESYILVAPN
eukprot:CAMPEP_0202965370 /NCGR_PEP_ID=MMETSP1396-20130829/9366_1 /ASSEMBLY_ACC=CAM_ASM_000872 /TAXON_ID= /ORGANISM="Pseudokeronopsis sp., Strain Brazil" /LENGTH=56 /DNA_ID=CAMNT_0049688059 /DNA_START=711 /DNA_END=881 /DNA_ORIENTATION=+